MSQVKINHCPQKPTAGMAAECVSGDGSTSDGCDASPLDSRNLSLANYVSSHASTTHAPFKKYRMYTRELLWDKDRVNKQNKHI